MSFRCCLMLLVLVAGLRAGEPVLLADAAGMRVVLVVPKPAEKLEQQAIADLVEYLARLHGGQPRTVAIALEALPATLATLRQAGELPLVLGSLALPALLPAITAQSQDASAFALEIQDTGMHLAGRTPAGTAYAVAELLERLGVRWFMPGELGTVVPRQPRLALTAGLSVQAPSFSGRQVSGVNADWARRMRLGGSTPAGSLDFPEPAPFAARPELYALVNGQRQASQLCLSHPELVPLLVVKAREYFAARPSALWLPVSSHGGGHCECADCRDLDPPGAATGPFTGGLRVADRYLGFCNRLLAALEAEFPDRRLSLTVATPHFLPPVATEGHPRLDVIGWAVGFCRLHGVDNPLCPDRALAHAYQAGWIKALRGRYYERGEWGHVAGPGLPFPMVQRYRAELPAQHALGVSGYNIAEYGNWIAQLPASYVAARLLWQHQADVDAILSDFYQAYYGPAAGPMRAWHELFEQTLRDADHHTGTAMDFPLIYPEAMRQRARALLAVARDLAKDAPYATRLAAMTLEMDYLDAFCTLIHERNQHRYAAAFAALEAARTLITRLQTDFPTPLLSKSFARNYLDQFFGNAVVQAHQRTSAGGKLVVGLADTWDFLLAPQATGELQRWQMPGRGGNWQALRAWSSSWSNQGLRTWAGDAWYRQTFDLPASATGPLRVWFGAVDESARVWLNGHLLGERATDGNIWRSFEFDAQPAARPGKPNTLVVRVQNHTMDEIGTGGLLAPVFLYTPIGE